MALPFPKNTLIPLFNAGSDTGKFVTAIITKYDAHPLGKRIIGTTAYYTPDDMLRTFSEVTGQTVDYAQVSEEVFKGFFPEFMAQEVFESFILIRDWAYYGSGAHELLKESLQVRRRRKYQTSDFRLTAIYLIDSGYQTHEFQGISRE